MKLSLHETATVSLAKFRNCLQTKEFTQLEPGNVEHKFYVRSDWLCPGVLVKGGKERLALTHNAGPNPTLDARVEALEKNIGSIQNQITGVGKELDEGFGKVRNEIRSEGQKREANDTKLGEKIEASAVGGIQVSSIGASWLFVGVALSTAAPELAAFMKS